MSANEKEEYYKELLERNSILGVINIIEKEVRQETLKEFLDYMEEWLKTTMNDVDTARGTLVFMIEHCKELLEANK